MDGEKPRSFRGQLTRTIIAVVVALLLIYPLSMGPALYLVIVKQDGDEDEEEAIRTFHRFYGPLLLGVSKTPFESAFSHYLDFWKELASK